MSNGNKIVSTTLDQIFDDNTDDVLPFFDKKTAHRPGLTIKKINVDMPQWMVLCLDDEAKRLGISRQSVIKTWLAERIDTATEGA